MRYTRAALCDIMLINKKKKKSLNSDGQQYHQYKKNKINSSHLKTLNAKMTPTYAD